MNRINANSVPAISQFALKFEEKNIAVVPEIEPAGIPRTSNTIMTMVENNPAPNSQIKAKERAVRPGSATKPEARERRKSQIRPGDVTKTKKV